MNRPDDAIPTPRPLEPLIADLPIRLAEGSLTVPIRDVTDDSRQVQPGDLFIARPGTQTSGLQYVDEAARRGAAAVLAEQPVELPAGVTLLIGQDTGALTGQIAERFFDHPSSKLHLIGVTGTNGKTTTAFMIRHLLNEAGRKCGLIGTIEIDDGHERRPTVLTTPGATDASRLLSRMVAAACDTCVMEVSSHALDQGRAGALSFRTGVFTNLSGDHLDYHGTMDAYAAAKARLFAVLPPDGWAVYNADDDHAGHILEPCRAAKLACHPDPACAHDLNDQTSSSCHVRVLGAHATHTDCIFDGPWGSVEGKLPLIGRHNADNMLTAMAAAHVAGAELATLGRSLPTCPPVPGRLEHVQIDDAELPFTVLVDYAHTDDALRNVLEAVRGLVRGKLRVMFGCGGDRDRTKRPRMAEVACRLADDVVMTSDNPRTEDPQTIIDGILTGADASAHNRLTVVVNRAEAIEHIIRRARDGDIILLAGKGHEDYQIIGHERLPFDDRQIAREALRRMTQSPAAQEAP